MIQTLDPLAEQPEDVRRAFTEVMAWIMAADGELRPEELAMVADLRRRLALAPSQAPHPPTWSEGWPALLRPVGAATLLQACLLATTDGDVAAEELDCLELLQDALDLDPGSVRAMLAWAQEGHRWIRKGQGLMAEARRGGTAP